MDVITLDMLPETNLRKKTMVMGNGYIVYINDNRYGYTHQYVRNMLFLNKGQAGFSEIGQLAGVHQTEWSWSPLLADFDNDGFKDLVVTNGYPKDITNNDFINFRKEAGPFTPKAQLLEAIPSVKIPNYAFRNKGDLTFEDVSETWGFTQTSFSNGAAFADFDLDGDLDYVVNNIDDPAFLYENTLSDRDQSLPNYLRVKLIGPPSNPFAQGAKVRIHYGNKKSQYHEQNLYRGYVSTVEEHIHFGLGDISQIDRLEVIWPDGKQSLREDIPANQVVEVVHENAQEHKADSLRSSQALFVDISAEWEPGYMHEEDDFIDYNIQRNIPHKFSQFGPAISVGDINGDEQDDFIVGAAKGFTPTYFLQQPDGNYEKKNLPEAGNLNAEDMGMLLFDADGDLDLDLYMVSGSFEYPEGDTALLDRLLLNDGKGNFQHAPAALPQVNSSGSCVRAADYDGDGDLDLFVGGRVLVGSYPKPTRSYILENEGGVFTDVTEAVSPDLAYLGMLSDATWTDYNGDEKVDLVVVGEFLPVSFFANRGGKLVLDTETGLSGYTGWWNSIISGDFDKDGDMDYVVGNVGKNNYFCASPETPVRVTANDFDGNGALDAILSCYLKAEDGTMQAFPIHAWEELNAQSPIFRTRFNRYEEYGKTTIDALLTEDELVGATILEANHMASSYLENTGGGKFDLKELPLEAQFAPVNGLQATDVNGDGNLDILMVGNDHGTEVNMGQYDAFKGLVLQGDGTGAFSPLSYEESGFLVSGDAKALSLLMGPGGEAYLLASQNRGPLRLFQNPRKAGKLLQTHPLEFSLLLEYEDGTTERVEVPYGAGYLSQSSRNVWIHHRVRKVILLDYQGQSRTVDFSDPS